MPVLSSSCLINLVRSPPSDSASRKPLGLVIPWLCPSYRELTILSTKLQYKSSIPLPGSTEKAGRENSSGAVFKVRWKEPDRGQVSTGHCGRVCVWCVRDWQLPADSVPKGQTQGHQEFKISLGYIWTYLKISHRVTQIFQRSLEPCERVVGHSVCRLGCLSRGE